MTPHAGGRVVAFGEVIMRCSPPGRELLLQSPRLDVFVGGAESNVVTQLARFGHATAMATALPPGPLGDAAIFQLRGNGVDVGDVARLPGRMGMYFVIPGSGLRATEVHYDRAGSAFAEAPVESWDWAALLEGAERLHLSGVTPAFSAKGSQAALAAAEAAHRLGVRVSFDGNYRGRLWAAWGGVPAETLPRLVERADVLFGNYRDISLLLATTLPGETPQERRHAAKAAFAQFPALEVIASTVRHVVSAGANRLAARIDTRGESFETDQAAIDAIVDRIGAGDAFAAGVLHGLSPRMPVTDVAAFALATSLLKHSLPGDVGLFTTAEVMHAMGTEFDVRR